MIKTRKLVKVSSQSDTEYALQINRWHLQPLGIWPLSSKLSYLEKSLANLVIAVCSFLLVLILVPGIIMLVKVTDPVMKLKIGGPISFCSMAIIKYCALLVKRQKIASCMRHLSSDWERVKSIDDRNTMIDYAQFGRHGAMLCAVFMYSGGVFFAGILPHLSARAMKNESNVTIRPFAYPVYFEFINPQESPVYEILFSVQCCCAFVMHSITSACCSLVIVFVMHTCGQLEILISWLQNYVDDKKSHPKSTTVRTLSDIIHHHVRILRFIASIDRALSEICLFEIAGSTLDFCIVAYDLLLEWKQRDTIGMITYAILLNAFVCNIFLFCYIGERLNEACRKVGETSYMIEWHRLSRKEVLGLALIITTAHNPVTLTAGKLLNLSLNSFCIVMRTSIAHLNFLRKLMQ